MHVSFMFSLFHYSREGVVLEKSNKTVSYVDIGLSTDVLINQSLQPGLRVTVHLPPEAQEMKRPYGTVVSPNEPREKAGYYWGYTVRVANSLSEVGYGSLFYLYTVAMPLM